MAMTPRPAAFRGNLLDETAPDWVGDGQIYARLGPGGDKSLFKKLRRMPYKPRPDPAKPEAETSAAEQQKFGIKEITNTIAAAKKCKIVVEPWRIYTERDETLVELKVVSGMQREDLFGAGDDVDAYAAVDVVAEQLRLVAAIAGEWDRLIVGDKTPCTRALFVSRGGEIVGLVLIFHSMQMSQPPQATPLETARPVPGIKPEYDRKTAPRYRMNDIEDLLLPASGGDIAEVEAHLEGEAGEVLFRCSVKGRREGGKSSLRLGCSQIGRRHEVFASSAGEGHTPETFVAAVRRKTGHEPIIRQVRLYSATAGQGKSLSIEVMRSWSRIPGTMMRVWTSSGVHHIIHEKGRCYYLVQTDTDSSGKQVRPSIAFPLEDYAAVVEGLTRAPFSISSMYNELRWAGSVRGGSALSGIERRKVPPLHSLQEALDDPGQRVVIGEAHGMTTSGAFLDAARSVRPGTIFRMRGTDHGPQGEYRMVQAGVFELLADCRTILYHHKPPQVPDVLGIMRLPSTPVSLADFAVEQLDRPPDRAIDIDDPDINWHVDQLALVVPSGDANKRACAARRRSERRRYELVGDRDAGWTINDRVTQRRLSGTFMDHADAGRAEERLNRIAKLADSVEADFGS